MKPCPPAEQIARLLDERLAAAEREALEAHCYDGTIQVVKKPFEHDEAAPLVPAYDPYGDGEEERAQRALVERAGRFGGDDLVERRVRRIDRHATNDRRGGNDGRQGRREVAVADVRGGPFRTCREQE